MKTYAEKLRDPKWIFRRAEMIEKRAGCCQQCHISQEDERLQVHHVCYVRGREPWDYPDELLLVLCKTCHFDRQVNDEEARFEFARLLAQMTSHEVHSLAKKMRASIDGGWKPKLFDAFEAITRRRS